MPPELPHRRAAGGIPPGAGGRPGSTAPSSSAPPLPLAAGLAAASPRHLSPWPQAHPAPPPLRKSEAPAGLRGTHPPARPLQSCQLPPELRGGGGGGGGGEGVREGKEERERPARQPHRALGPRGRGASPTSHRRRHVGLPPSNNMAAA